MINGFKTQTQELSEYERREVLPRVIKGLKTKVGVENAVTNKTMVEGLKKLGIKTSGPRMRKIIHEIRITGEIPYLIATSKGYYITRDKSELLNYIESLEQRAASIRAIACQLEYQLGEI